MNDVVEESREIARQVSSAGIYGGNFNTEVTSCLVLACHCLHIPLGRMYTHWVRSNLISS
jgi:hypothetical protein